jgi:c-di-GMP-specific phosphodiesterase
MNKARDFPAVELAGHKATSPEEPSLARLGVARFEFQSITGCFRFWGHRAIMGSNRVEPELRLGQMVRYLTDEGVTTLIEALKLAQKSDISQQILLPNLTGGCDIWQLRATAQSQVHFSVFGIILPLDTNKSLTPSQRYVLVDSHKDGLTGLLNRQGFVSAADELLKKTGSYDLVLADCHQFSALNAAIGIERADEVLKQLSLRLKQEIGQDWPIGRVGEDEFVALLPRHFPRASDRLRHCLERPLDIADITLYPSFTMGAVGLEGGDQAPDIYECLRRAEMAKEKARSKGVWGVAAWHKGLEKDGLTLLELGADLRQAFTHGEIKPYFQPIVDLQTGKVAGFEALARWEHPKNGLIAPVDFIPLVRNSGLLWELTSSILSQSVNRLVQWSEDFDIERQFFVSVNVTAQDLDHPQLVSDITQWVKRIGDAKGILKIEITENDMVNDIDHCVRILNQLKASGASLALDDFGTGFSSLSHLAHLPFDTLKIDQSFVQALGEDQNATTIIRSLIRLASDLGLMLVAEGVETLDLGKLLLSEGCRLGQGYGLAKAMPVDQATEFLSVSTKRKSKTLA